MGAQDTSDQWILLETKERGTDGSTKFCLPQEELEFSAFNACKSSLWVFLLLLPLCPIQLFQTKTDTTCGPNDLFSFSRFMFFCMKLYRYLFFMKVYFALLAEVSRYIWFYNLMCLFYYVSHTWLNYEKPAVLNLIHMVGFYVLFSYSMLQ